MDNDTETTGKVSVSRRGVPSRQTLLLVLSLALIVIPQVDRLPLGSTSQVGASRDPKPTSSTSTEPSFESGSGVVRITEGKRTRIAVVASSGKLIPCAQGLRRVTVQQVSDDAVLFTDDGDLYEFPLDCSRPARLVARPVDLGGKKSDEINCAAASPDGRHLLIKFTYEDSLLSDRQGKVIRRLRNVFGCSWLDDDHVKGCPVVWPCAVDIASGGTRILRHPWLWSGPRSPDGRFALFETEAGKFRLHDRETSKTRTLTLSLRAKDANEEPAAPIVWSEDSKRFLVAQRPGRPLIVDALDAMETGGKVIRLEGDPPSGDRGCQEAGWIGADIWCAGSSYLSLLDTASSRIVETDLDVERVASYRFHAKEPVFRVLPRSTVFIPKGSVRRVSLGLDLSARLAPGWRAQQCKEGCTRLSGIEFQRAILAGRTIRGGHLDGTPVGLTTASRTVDDVVAQLRKHHRAWVQPEGERGSFTVDERTIEGREVTVVHVGYGEGYDGYVLMEVNGVTAIVLVDGPMWLRDPAVRLLIGSLRFSR